MVQFIKTSRYILRGVIVRAIYNIISTIYGLTHICKNNIAQVIALRIAYNISITIRMYNGTRYIHL